MVPAFRVKAGCRSDSGAGRVAVARHRGEGWAAATGGERSVGGLGGASAGGGRGGRVGDSSSIAERTDLDGASCATALLEREPSAAACTADCVVARRAAEGACHRMRRPAVRPRRDQVEELTRGLQLPLAAIADEHMDVVADGLRQAFEDVRLHARATVATGEESEVTGLVQARLNRLVHEDSLWGAARSLRRKGNGEHQLRWFSSREAARPVDCSVRPRSALSVGRGSQDSGRRGVEDGGAVLQGRDSALRGGRIRVGWSGGIHDRLRPGRVVDRHDAGWLLGQRFVLSALPG